MATTRKPRARSSGSNARFNANAEVDFPCEACGATTIDWCGWTWDDLRLCKACYDACPVSTSGPVGGGSQNTEMPTCAACRGRCIEVLRDGLCAECWRRYPRLREKASPSTPGVIDDV